MNIHHNCHSSDFHLLNPTTSESEICQEIAISYCISPKKTGYLLKKVVRFACSLPSYLKAERYQM